ncbi:hypothetical protein [Pontibacter indicus]|uniref:Uncharacterized protein n=1 Tax=Pontibacter indicus TaxID=1317125 RepID=A0A1R3WZN4_9BACT|nr:hypothetical protein [Pontibacter indicus]SIT83005.1 hypothetical protein SAMN05444128_1202 [Pontibacter indicus]
MRKPTLYLIAPLVIMLTAFSCDKDEDLDAVETTATLFWTGDVAVDGCGYSVQIGEKSYKPENEGDIDASFKVYEPIPVAIKLIHKGEREIACGMLPGKSKRDFVRVLSIRKI